MVYEFQGNRTEFLNLLNENPGVMIFKYTADWCKPCQTIKKEVDEHFLHISSPKIKCYEVNVDDNFDLFAFMKTKKMMKGIPMIIAYKQGTTSFVPDDSISGTDITEINAFFKRCSSM